MLHKELNMPRQTFLVYLLSALLAASSAFADESTTMFPFVIEKGAPDNITNVQTWAEPAPVAGADGFFFNDAGVFASKSGQTRLLGTNFCFGACFPSKEKAERVAETLSRFGIGIVRLHHMDSRDIWGKNFAKGTTEIDPEKLDQLDYLIYCLQQKGIYVNINLHVSRAFKEVDGFENADKLPTHNKGVDNFDRKMIEYQKKYAKDLLQHVNPYTGKAYVDDPGVAVVEINNENSVVASWAWGNLDDLPEPYSKDFQKLWNQWLLKKYGSTDKLRAAWDCRSIPLGDNMIGAGFDEGFKFDADWRLETDAQVKCSYKVIPASETGIDAPALQFNVEQMGEVAWRPQFNFSGLKLKKGSPYLVQFKLRVISGTGPNAAVTQAHDPWTATGFSVRPKASSEWTTISIPFVAIEDDDMMRLSFSGFQAGASFELADVTFREGGDFGFAQGLTLEDGTIPVAKKQGEPTMMGAQGVADFSDFLHDLEDGYWQEMYNYIKSLGAKSPISGTQLQYGFWHNQGRLDYCDIHAYWNHPNFPRRSWDGNDWLVRNTCLANSPDTGTLSNLASLRILGSPFTCSEYDHPYPNQYCAEGNVMLAAVAAFQDWSATFQFAWSHNDNFERDSCSAFFDQCSQTVKIAHLPACYGMFVREDVQAGPGEFYYAPSMTEDKEKEIMGGLLTSYHRPLAKGLGIDQTLSLAVYSGVELPDLKLPKSDALKAAKKVESWDDLPKRFGSVEGKKIVNDFGEITWNYREKDKGYFTVDTANTKVFSGFVTAPQEFDGMTLDIGDTELGWATVSLVKAKNAVKGAKKIGKLTPGNYLLTATGLMQNTDAELVKVGENDVTTAGHFGGKIGRAPILCEGVPATVRLSGVPASKVEVYALTNRGDRADQLTVKRSSKGCEFSFGPKQKTIWYEIVVK